VSDENWASWWRRDCHDRVAAYTAACPAQYNQPTTAAKFCLNRPSIKCLKQFCITTTTTTTTTAAASRYEVKCYRHKFKLKGLKSWYISSINNIICRARDSKHTCPRTEILWYLLEQNLNICSKVIGEKISAFLCLDVCLWSWKC